MTPLRVAGNVSVMVALSAIALVPLSAAYGDVAFWIAALGGIILGAAVAVLGRRWRWHALTLAVAALATYFVFGAALAFRADALFGVLPTADILLSLALGLVQVWKEALTLQTPFVGFDQVLILPLVAGLATSTTAVTLALRASRLSALALVAPGALLTLSIAFSTFRGFHPGFVGAAWGALALAWVVWRRDLRRRDGSVREGLTEQSTARGRGIRPAIGAVAVIAVALTAGAATATAVSAGEREVLRDHIVPPLDLRDYASPLTSFRKFMRDGEDSTLFTVSGLPAGAPIRLATLDLYDGVVYQVSGAGGAGSGVFSRVGREIDTSAVGTPVAVEVVIEELSGVWVPMVGYPRRIAFDGEKASALDSSLHVNAATGTAIATVGVAEGDRYSLDAIVPALPDLEDIADARVSAISTPAPAAVPDEVSALLNEVITGAESPIEQLRAIEAFFQTEGYYSSGLEGQVVSRSGHTLERQSTLFGGAQMIGDGEQYAVAMALMVSQLGLPVRVVMGFLPEDGGETVALTGDDLQAWVEVPFDGVGWVSFSPTPSRDRVPQQEVPEQQQRPQAQVAQPPQSPQEPAELPPDAPVQDAEPQEEEQDLSWLWTLIQVVGASFLVLLALFGPSLAFALARARRRSLRRKRGSPVSRVDGGWAELIDSATDIGVPLRPGATRREHAADMDDRHPTVAVTALAERADAVVFGSGSGEQVDVNGYWEDVERARRALRSAVPWHRRIRGALIPSSLFRGGARSPRRRRGRSAS